MGRSVDLPDVVRSGFAAAPIARERAATALKRRRVNVSRRGVVCLTGALVCMAAWYAAPAVAFQDDASGLRDAVMALARTSSVTGREDMAADHVRALLGDLEPAVDALGNLALTLGTGAPRRLLAVPLDEPGYVVSRIDGEGYLRITPVGQPYRGTLVHQALEGNEVTVVTADGILPGAVGVPSAHLTSYAREPTSRWPPFAWQDAHVDIGAGGAGEAAAMGIRLMDTLTLIKRPALMAGDLVAAPSIQTKAAVVALVDAAHRLADDPGAGTTVLAWTRLGLINGKGLETVVHEHGPFDEAWLFHRDFGWDREGRAFVPVPTAPLGSGVLSDDGSVGTGADHLDISRHPTTGGPDWGDSVVHRVGLPTRYQDTPVETVALADVAALADSFARAAGSTGHRPPLPRLEPPAHAEIAGGPFRSWPAHWSDSSQSTASAVTKARWRT